MSEVITHIQNSDNAKKKFQGHAHSIIQAWKEMESLKEDVKSYMTALKEEFDLPPAMVRKALKTYWQQTLEDEKKAQSNVESLVEILSETKGVESTTDED